jgi:hypothetical protein
VLGLQSFRDGGLINITSRLAMMDDFAVVLTCPMGSTNKPRFGTFDFWFVCGFQI